MERFAQRFLVLVALACTAGPLLGCRGRISESAPLKIGYSIESGESPWQRSYLQAFKDEVERLPNLGIDWSIGNADRAAIISTLERWIAEKVQLIISSSPDHVPYRMIYRKALAAGIPVMLTMEAPDHLLFDAVTTFSGFGSWESGRLAAETLDRTLGGRGSIACITGPRGSASEQQNTEGFEAALRRLASRIRIVAREDGRGNATVAYQKTLDILDRFPDIDAIYAADDAMGSAVVRALKQKGLQPGQVKVVSQGGSKGSIADLKEGWYLGIIYQDPLRCARQDLWLVRALLEHRQQLPSVALVRQIVISSDQADSVAGW